VCVCGAEGGRVLKRRSIVKDLGLFGGKCEWCQKLRGLAR
jgi:hypothetical protein